MDKETTKIVKEFKKIIKSNQEINFKIIFFNGNRGIDEHYMKIGFVDYDEAKSEMDSLIRNSGRRNLPRRNFRIIPFLLNKI